jgi:hypothetical protein
MDAKQFLLSKGIFDYQYIVDCDGESIELEKLLADYAQALQLLQAGVSGSYSEFPHKKVCFFKIENGKYLTDNGMEITNEMLIKHSHHIGFPWNYIVLE